MHAACFCRLGMFSVVVAILLYNRILLLPEAKCHHWSSPCVCLVPCMRQPHYRTADQRAGVGVAGAAPGCLADCYSSSEQGSTSCQRGERLPAPSLAYLPTYLLFQAECLPLHNFCSSSC